MTRTVGRPYAMLLAYGGSLGVLLVVLAALHGPAATTVRRPGGARSRGPLLRGAAAAAAED